MELRLGVYSLYHLILTKELQLTRFLTLASCLDEKIEAQKCQITFPYLISTSLVTEMEFKRTPF